MSDAFSDVDLFINTKVDVHREAAKLDLNKMTDSRVEANIMCYDGGKPKDNYSDIETEASGMTYPIKSEAHAQKQRTLVVNGILFYEKRKAFEIWDAADSTFLVIGVLRKIGDKRYQTCEVFKNGISQGQTCNLDGEEKQHFESKWKANWKLTNMNDQVAETKNGPNKFIKASNGKDVNLTPISKQNRVSL